MLKIFGDSFSSQFVLNEHAPSDFNELCEKHWSVMLGKKLNLQLCNYARCGATNLYILHTIIEQLHTFSSDDIVVINLTGQGRLPLGPNGNLTWFTNGIHSLNMFTNVETNLSKSDYKNIKWWYENIFLPDIIDNDPYINDIILLVNHIETIVKKVILWNITPLGITKIRDASKNDNVTSSPELNTTTKCWHPLSENGKEGWIDILYNRNLNIASFDLHPNLQGHSYIYKQFYNVLKPEVKASLL